MKRRQFIEFNMGLGITGLLATVNLKAQSKTKSDLLDKKNPDLSIAYWQESQYVEDLFGMFVSAELNSELSQTLAPSDSPLQLKKGFTLLDENQLQHEEPSIHHGVVRISLLVLQPTQSVWANLHVEDFQVLARTVPPELNPDMPAVILWHYMNRETLNAGSANQIDIQLEDDFGVLLETSFDPKGTTRWPLYFKNHSNQAGIPLNRGIYFAALPNPHDVSLPNWSEFLLHSSDKDNQAQRKYLYEKRGSQLEMASFPYFALVVEEVATN